MDVSRDERGTWQVVAEPSSSVNSEYLKVLPRYLNAYDSLFAAAKARSEFDFILALVHRESDSHTDEFETTKRAFKNVSFMQSAAPDYESEVTLALWLYGHIVEASYPYQLVGNLVGIAGGSNHSLRVFERAKDGAELSPGLKIAELERRAAPIGLKISTKPLRESWNPLYRNAIFHSNYALFGDKIRLVAVARTFDVSRVMARVNRAAASFEALLCVEQYYRLQYKDKMEIDAPEYFAHEAGTKVTVVVREGFGPIAIYSTVLDFGNPSPVILGRVTAFEFEKIRTGQFFFPEMESGGNL